MTDKKQLPNNWWDLGINSIVGFRIPRAGEKKKHKRNENEYHPDDNIKYWKENE